MILKDARAHHRAGRLEDAEGLYRQILAATPDCAEAHIDLALALWSRGRVDEALVHCRRGVALAPSYAEGHCQLADILAFQNRLPEAETSYRRAIAARPDFAEAHNNLGNVLLQCGRLTEAIASYHQALTARPDFGEAHHNLGMVWLEQGKVEEAKSAFARAVAIAPDHADAHNSLGHILLRQDRPEEAADSFRRAVAANPDHAGSLNNLGVALAQLGCFADAAEACRRAIAVQPNYPEAYRNLGKCLVQTGAHREAEASFRTSLQLAPSFADGHRHLAMLLEETGRLDEAIVHFNRHAALVFGPAGRGRPPTQDPPHKQRHDREQQAWLGARAAPFMIGDGGRVQGLAINRSTQAEKAGLVWRNARPQILVIDDFLTPLALEKLRRFCLESTIWHESYEDGYLGAFPEHGFAQPLLAQIAEDMRASYPGIIEDHPLLQFWAFKYDSELKGIRVHADFAAVNVNFWITPDEANLDSDHGGLVVWDKAAPADWNFAKYNGAEADIRAFLTRSGAKAIRVPYRANRAVIFDSDLFHETDTIRFKSGYENRRINVTLLFGRRMAGKGI
jgi:Tfp pilus assembly protein PilF